MTIIRMNRPTKYFTGILEELNRRTSDEFGNPSYEVVVKREDGTKWKGVTQKSAAFAYGIGNLLGKPVQVSYSGAKTVTNCRSL